MKLIDLIEKLKTEKGENGIWYVFRAWIIDMSNAKYTRNKDEYYEVIRGFLWGLEATDYITQEEKDQLLNELLEEYNKTNVLID